jgi:pheromone shutdown protein TraB
MLRVVQKQARSPAHARSTPLLIRLRAQTCSTSADEIREVIEAVQPSVVMLELCPSRYAAMFPNRNGSRLNAAAVLSEQVNVSLPLRGQDGRGEEGAGEVQDMAQGTQTVDWALRGVYRLMDRLGMKPGRDFVAAVDAANTVGAQLVLGDRDALETMAKIAGLRDLREVFNTEEMREGVLGLVDSVRPATDGRVWLPDVLLLSRRMREALPLLSLIMMSLALSGVLAWSTEAMLGVSNDAHRAVDDVVFAVPLFAMLAILPRAYTAIIGSRDAYLLHSLLECCALLHGGSSPSVGRGGACEAKTVVGVVGLLHVNGMTKRFLRGQRPGHLHQPTSAAAAAFWLPIARSAPIVARSQANGGDCDGLSDGLGEREQEKERESLLETVLHNRSDGQGDAHGDGKGDGDALPHAVWVSGDKQYSRFVPPPGYEWACADGQDFSVTRKPAQRPLRDYWRRSSSGRTGDGGGGGDRDSGGGASKGGGGSSGGMVGEGVGSAQGSAAVPLTGSAGLECEKLKRDGDVDNPAQGGEEKILMK